MSTSRVVTRTLQFDAQLPPGRMLRIFGTGFQPIIVNDTEVVSVGQADYDQRLVELCAGLRRVSAAPVGRQRRADRSGARSIEMVKLDMRC